MIAGNFTWVGIGIIICLIGVIWILRGIRNIRTEQAIGWVRSFTDSGFRKVYGDIALRVGKARLISGGLILILGYCIAINEMIAALFLSLFVFASLFFENANFYGKR